MKKDLAYYSKKFIQLRVDRSRGQAPYQPLLLLSLIELVEQGLVRENRFPISPELISVFIKYRNQLSSAFYRADLAQPFFHMSRKEGTFWHLVPKTGHENVIRSGGKLNTLNKLRENVQYGHFDDELFELLQNPIQRNSLIINLINKWFPDNFAQIKKLLQIHSFEQLQQSLRESGGAIYTDEEDDELETEVRNAAFRRNLLALYDQRCAFCKLRVVSINNEKNIVDGAHIMPFSKFRDNRYTNGLALCKNHHWAFDHGWFSIDDDYTILISNGLQEESPHATPMRNFHGKQIWLPLQEQYRPRLEALRWHRHNNFIRI